MSKQQLLANEMVPISPESMEIIQVYLSTQSIPETARRLGIHDTQVSQYLRKTEVKNYLDHCYLSAGFRNRDKIAEAMDNIISMKMEEMVETGLGSTKDIADLLALAHKFRVEEIKLMIDHEKATNGSTTVKKQTNVQINGSPYGEGNYGELLGKLLG